MATSAQELLRQMMTQDNQQNEWFKGNTASSAFGGDLDKIIADLDGEEIECSVDENNQLEQDDNKIFTIARERELALAREHYVKQWETYCENNNISQEERVKIEANAIDPGKMSKHNLMWFITLGALTEIDRNTDIGHALEKAKVREAKELMQMQEAELLEYLSYAFVESPSEGIFDTPACKEFDEMFMVGGKVLIIPTDHTHNGQLSFIAASKLYKQNEDGYGTRPIYKLYMYPHQLGIYYFEKDELTKEQVIQILENEIRAAPMHIEDQPVTFEEFLKHCLQDDEGNDEGNDDVDEQAPEQEQK